MVVFLLGLKKSYCSLSTGLLKWGTKMKNTLTVNPNKNNFRFKPNILCFCTKQLLIFVKTLTYFHRWKILRANMSQYMSLALSSSKSITIKFCF